MHDSKPLEQLVCEAGSGDGGEEVDGEEVSACLVEVCGGLVLVDSQVCLLGAVGVVVSVGCVAALLSRLQASDCQCRGQADYCQLLVFRRCVTPAYRRCSSDFPASLRL